MTGHLKWLDSLTIRAIISCDEAPTMQKIQHFINAFKVANEIPDYLCIQIRDKPGLYSSFGRLRKAGLMEEDEMALTDKGREFYMGLSNDWRKWPKRIPILLGEPDMKRAEYQEVIRG